jgi:hypothetical protein
MSVSNRLKRSLVLADCGRSLSATAGRRQSSRPADRCCRGKDSRQHRRAAAATDAEECSRLRPGTTPHVHHRRQDVHRGDQVPRDAFRTTHALLQKQTNQIVEKRVRVLFRMSSWCRRYRRHAYSTRLIHLPARRSRFHGSIRPAQR